MAKKKWLLLPGSVAAGSPLVGYLVYDQLTEDTLAGQEEEEEKEEETKPEPIIVGEFKPGPCSRKLFDGVDFRFLSGGTSKGEFDLKWDGSGRVDACLNLFIKREADEKGPQGAYTELTVVQGNKAFLMWTVVLGKAHETDKNISEEIRVALMEKKGGKWEPTKGFSWFTKPVLPPNKPKRIMFRIKGDNSGGNSTQKNGELYNKVWRFDVSSSGLEGVFSKLEIAYEGEKASGLFGTRDYEISSESLLYGTYGTMDTGWKWSPKDKRLHKKVEIPFKGIKGKWVVEKDSKAS